MARVYISLGSNLRPEANLRFAVRELAGRFAPLSRSSVYRNASVGFDGDDFLNMVAGFDSALSPLALNALFESLHAQSGRQRGGERIAARTLDIDLLLYDQLVSNIPALPRDDVLRFNFVLKPLAEIAADLVHPVTQQTIGEHWRQWRGLPHSLTAVPLDFD